MLALRCLMRLGGINHWAGTSLHQTHLGRLSFWKDEPSAWTDIFWLQGFDFKLVTLEQQGFGGWHALFQGLNPHYSWLAFSFPPRIFCSMIRLHDRQKHREGGEETILRPYMCVTVEWQEDKRGHFPNFYSSVYCIYVKVIFLLTVNTTRITEG